MSRRGVVCLLGLLVGACGGGGGGPVDAPCTTCVADGGADAAVSDAPVDGPAIDGMIDAAAIDAMTDAAVDATVDAAAIDAMPDAAPDAPTPDAPVDAAPDAPTPDAPIDAAPPDAPPWTNGVSTLAGGGSPGFVDGSRDVAALSNPVNVALGPDGLIYVADFDNDAIRAIDALGNVTTVYTATDFQRPFGLAFDPATGALYVSTDNDNNGVHSLLSGTLWKLDVVAGTATVIAPDIGRPRGLGVLPDGRVVLSDSLHHTVSLLDPADNDTITVLAGAFDVPDYVDAVGPAARFDRPYGVAIVAGPAIAVADYENHRVRLIQLDGTTTTIAGDGTPAFLDGAALSAELDHPEALATDAAGDLFIADTDNFRIRKLAGGQVTTVAGDGTGGYLDADDPLAAELYGLEGLCATSDGTTLYVADGNRGNPLPYDRVRVVKLP